MVSLLSMSVLACWPMLGSGFVSIPPNIILIWALGNLPINLLTHCEYVVAVLVRFVLNVTCRALIGMPIAVDVDGNWLLVIFGRGFIAILTDMLQWLLLGG